WNLTLRQFSRNAFNNYSFFCVLVADYAIRVLLEVACLPRGRPCTEVICPAKPEAPDHHGMRRTIRTDRREPVIVRLAEALPSPLPRQSTFQRLGNAIACHTGPGGLRFGAATVLSHLWPFATASYMRSTESCLRAHSCSRWLCIYCDRRRKRAPSRTSLGLVRREC